MSLRSLSLLLIVAVIALVFVEAAMTQPGAKDMKEYEKWTKETYIPDRLNYEDQAKKAAEKSGKATVDGSKQQIGIPGVSEAYFLRGNIAPDVIADIDADLIKELFFPICNDGRISDYDKFFEKPQITPFICALGIVGNDPNTGEELSKLLCQQEDPRGCGVHFDNRHDDLGGVVGLGIIFEMPVDNILCNKIYVTGSYVEYFMPWNLVNASRGMYQSMYLDRIFVEATRFMSTISIAVMALQETLPTLDIFKRVANQELQDSGKGGMGAPIPDVGLNQMQAFMAIFGAFEAVLSADPKLRDLVPYSKQGFARNFSSIMDMEQLEDNYWWVPHYNYDTHRFGTDLPHMGDLEKPKAKDNPEVPLPGDTSGGGEKKKNVGGNPYGRFLSAQEKVGKSHSKRAKDYFKKFTETGGPRICLNNNIQTKKVPEDFYEFSEKKKAEDYHFCTDFVGNRFPLSHYSFSLHDTDAVWRAFAGGAFDQFYLLNWPEHYDGELSGMCNNIFITPFTCVLGLFSYFPQKFHTYFESLDRVRIMPDIRLPLFGAEVMPDFFIETFGKGFPMWCPSLQGPLEGLFPLQDYNVNYKKSNLADPGHASEQTAYVFGLAKGVWGFKGWPFFRAIPNGTARYPWVYARFS